MSRTLDVSASEFAYCMHSCPKQEQQQKKKNQLIHQIGFVTLCTAFHATGIAVSTCHFAGSLVRSR